MPTPPSPYAARADEYIAAVGRIEHTDPADRALLQQWAATVNGPILDVGCGPGQWTEYLTAAGADIAGIDPVPEFIDRARADYPHFRFDVGRAEQLPVADRTLGGILAWYSLIHTPPEQIGAALAEFARCLRPDGRLALGFFTGTRQDRFAHAVQPAYRWPVDLLVSVLETAGFRVDHTETRSGRPDRDHGAILAARRA
ncbi:class I SAM-dependent methyltransferase [Gordonia alkaliphila]|uniref:Methyltransferase domain-containing protein n=1 Tax=Gordonia alkaliphila TaxID=1053547 RepID=A0ABP8ZB97_9ACTN